MSRLFCSQFFVHTKLRKQSTYTLLNNDNIHKIRYVECDTPYHPRI
jgi:hypothetical protein